MYIIYVNVNTCWTATPFPKRLKFQRCIGIFWKRDSSKLSSWGQKLDYFGLSNILSRYKWNFWYSENGDAWLSNIQHILNYTIYKCACMVHTQSKLKAKDCFNGTRLVELWLSKNRFQVVFFWCFYSALPDEYTRLL